MIRSIAGARRRTVGHTVATILVATAATLALTGCDLDRAGAAAVVGGDSITQSELQDRASETLAVLPDADPGQVQQDILQDMIVLRVYRQMARPLDVAVSDADIARERDRIFEQVRSAAAEADLTPREYVVTQLAQGEGNAYIAPSQFEDWVRARLLEQDISAELPGGEEGSEAFVAASRALDITVNPRYGRWSSAGGLQAQVGGGLSKTVAELTSSS